MRLLISALFVAASLSAIAQDPGQQILLDQQIQQQAIQQATLANQQALQANQQAAQAAQQTADSSGGAGPARKPRFSLKPGSYPASTVLRLKDSLRGSVIYYTTDGWSPTTNSTRYTGPIVLTATETIQAIAVAPGFYSSQVATAAYTVTGAPSATPAGDVAALYRGMPLPLTFTAPVSSQGLEVGDKLPVALAEDLIVGGALLAPKATPVLVTVTQVDRPGRGGLPATLSFAVHSLVLLDGETIALSGVETKEGQSRTNTVNSIGIIPFGGLSGIFVKGRDLEIPQGATLTARVDADPAPEGTR